MNWNKYRQEKILFAMYKKNISKVELSTHLGMSYPTMLTKLKDIGTFKMSEFDQVCTFLDLDINELIKNKW